MTGSVPLFGLLLSKRPSFFLAPLVSSRRVNRVRPLKPDSVPVVLKPRTGRKTFAPQLFHEMWKLVELRLLAATLSNVTELFALIWMTVLAPACVVFAITAE